MAPVDRASLRCLAKTEDFERKLAKRFVVSDTVSRTRHARHRSVVAIDASKILQADRSNADACGTLSVLPGEVLLDIFDTLGHAPSQVAFALTCKRLATLAASIDLTRTLTSPKYAGFLSVGAFDVPDLMASLRSWSPTSIRLCGHCLTFRPSGAEYWQSKKGFERNDFWIQKIGWSFKGIAQLRSS